MSLLDVVNEAIEDDDISVFNHYSAVVDEVVYVHRWSYTTRLVLTDGVDYVEVHYDSANTEYQDSELNAVARQVYPVEKIVTVYV